MSIAVGIDLGTTNTVVGAVREGRAVTIPDEQGRRLIPSIVSFHPSGKVLVGEPAKDRRVIDPTNTIYSVKRLIGRTWDAPEVERAKNTFPFQIAEGPKKGVTVTARGETYTLPEISAFVLRRAKAIAEAALGEPVERAVVTVPANFNDLQRAATKLAGKLAGLEVLRILNEPTAAALAYGQSSGATERIGVYDLGGGTFDITLLDLSANVFEVLATGGDTSLGGDDIDQLIAEKMTMHILEKHRFDVRTDPSARANVRGRAEMLKHELSVKDSATSEMKDVVHGVGGDFIPVSFTMTRAELEKLAMPLIDRTLLTCKASMEMINAKLSDLDRIILVGGSTRMPLVVRKVEEYFKRPATGRVNPDEVVALGAAIQASALNRLARGKARAAAAPPSPVTPVAEVVKPAPHPQAGLPVVNPGAQKAPAAAAPPVPPRAPAPAAAQPPPAPAPATAPQAQSPAPGAQTLIGNAMADVPPPPTWLTETAAAVTASKAAPAEPPPPPQQKATGAPSQARSLAAPLATPPEPKDIIPADDGEASISTTTEQTSPFTFELDLPGQGTAPSPSAAMGGGAAAAVAQMQARPIPAPAIVEKPAPLLIDVTPISLGVEVAGGFTDVLIAANTPVPCDRTRVFLTASNGQTSVVVRVAQGESKRFAENTALGDVELSGLRPMPRGEVKIAVTFEIDADGILNVKAKDVESGREQIARMHLLGAQQEAGDVASMMARQARHAVG